MGILSFHALLVATAVLTAGRDAAQGGLFLFTRAPGRHLPSIVSSSFSRVPRARAAADVTCARL